MKTAVMSRSRLPKIDYPEDDQSVLAGPYTLRVSAPGAARVDVSIDRKPWRACRHAVGFWWCDAELDEGAHQAVVRVASEDKRYLMSLPRRFKARRP